MRAICRYASHNRFLMGKVYVPERQVEYWTSRQIEDFLWDAGFETHVFPLTQGTEKHIPADFIFMPGSPIKLFGLQYKVLYRDVHDYWKTPQTQIDQVSKFGWLYYGLSDLKALRDARNALHALRICDASKIVAPRTTVAHFGQKVYFRWWAFFESMRACKFGLQLRHEGDFLGAMAPVWDVLPQLYDVHDAVDIFLLQLEGRRAIRFTNLLTGELDRFHQRYDESPTDDDYVDLE